MPNIVTATLEAGFEIWQTRPAIPACAPRPDTRESSGGIGHRILPSARFWVGTARAARTIGTSTMVGQAHMEEATPRTKAAAPAKGQPGNKVRAGRATLLVT